MHFHMQCQVCLKEYAYGKGRREIKSDAGIAAYSGSEALPDVPVHHISGHQSRPGEKAVGRIPFPETPLLKYHVMKETEPDSRYGRL